MAQSGKVGKCSVCNNDAAWNTPYIDKRKNLYCETCGHGSTTMLQGVSQFTEDGKYVPVARYTKNHCVIHADVPLAWTDDGGKAFRLLPNECKLIKQGKMEMVFDKMIALRAKGWYRCSDCGTEMSKDAVGGFPLFAGVACKSCMKRHRQNLEAERKAGHVCRRCGQPYGNCCC